MSDIDKNPSNFIFYFIDTINDNNKIPNKHMIQFILDNPSCLFINGYHTAYTYASTKPLSTFILFHQFYSDIKDKLPDVYIKPYEIYNERGYNLLHYLIHNIINNTNNDYMKNYKNILYYILNNLNININTLNSNGETALVYLIKRNKTELVKLLLFYKADPSIKYKNKKILHHIISKNKTHLFNPIISKLSKHDIESELKLLNKNTNLIKENHKDKLFMTMHSYKKICKGNKTKKLKDKNNEYKVITYKDYIKKLYIDLIKTEQLMNEYIKKLDSQLDENNSEYKYESPESSQSDNNCDNDDFDDEIEKEIKELDFEIVKKINDESDDVNNLENDVIEEINNNDNTNENTNDNTSESNDENDDVDIYEPFYDSSTDIIHKFYVKLYNLARKLDLPFCNNDEELKSVMSTKIYLLHKDIY